MILIVDTETTGLDPQVDELVGIGWSSSTWLDPQVYVRSTRSSEEGLLRDFLRLISRYNSVTFVGYNIGFDLDFLRTRAEILALDHLLPTNISTIDVMDAVVEATGRRLRLPEAASIFLGREASDIPGSEVPRAWREGRIHDIYEHLREDIIRTWLLWKKFWG